MIPRNSSDPRIEKMKEEVQLVAVQCRLQLNAFLDYGFTNEEAFELVKHVLTIKNQTV